jgi:beta-glucosidase
MKKIFLAGVVFSFANMTMAAPIADYKNSRLSAAARADDLLSKMTLTEKVGQMCQYVGIEHIKKSEKYLTLEEMRAGDAYSVYPNLHSSRMPDLIKRGEIGSFLHVVDPKEANQLQQYASESRLGIPLIIGIDAIHGNGLVNGSTIYPSPLTMASSWNLDLVRQANVETAIEMRANGAQWSFTPNIDIALIRVGEELVRPLVKTLF